MDPIDRKTDVENIQQQISLSDKSVSDLQKNLKASPNPQISSALQGKIETIMSARRDLVAKLKEACTKEIQSLQHVVDVNQQINTDQHKKATLYKDDSKAQQIPDRMEAMGNLLERIQHLQGIITHLGEE